MEYLTHYYPKYSNCEYIHYLSFLLKLLPFIIIDRISEKSKPRFNIPNLRETVQGLISRIKSKGKEVGEEVK